MARDQGVGLRRKADRRRATVPEGATAITAEDIARRAYELYEARGATPDQDLDDWLQAERELNNTQRVRTSS
jgi:DUF2934 family protein